MAAVDEMPTTAKAAEGLDSLLVLNILRTHNRLTPFLDRSFQDLNITAAQFNVLLVLRTESTSGLPLCEIGRRLVVTKANVTGLVDRLEQKGLVYRDTVEDRRVTMARLTPDGAQLVGRILPRHRETLSEVMECLTADEKERLIELLTRLRHGMREKLKQESRKA